MSGEPNRESTQVIDNVIDNLIDAFYALIRADANGTMARVYSEMNFVKYQAAINDLLINFIGSIDIRSIRELVHTNDAANTVIEACKRYVVLYLFLTIGYNYAFNPSTFVSNVVEFSSLQGSYSFKADDTFNATSNALIFEYFTLVRNIVAILGADKRQIELFKQKSEYTSVFAFLNKLGGRYIDGMLRIKDKSDAGHNIIKTVLILQLYRVREKRDFYKLLEGSEDPDSEHIYIDIQVPVANHVTFDAIELLFADDIQDAVNANLLYDPRRYIAHMFWEQILENAKRESEPRSLTDSKIITLIECGLLIPIVDDFLLLHRDTEHYDKHADQESRWKNTTRIKYIVDKIDSAADLRSNKVRSDPKLLRAVEKKFFPPMMDRNAVLVNRIEDMAIIAKMDNQTRLSAENEHYYNELQSYVSYPYVNFKHLHRPGYPITLSTKTCDVLRLTSFVATTEQKTNRPAQWRVASPRMTINVVGFAVTNLSTNIKCARARDFVDVRSLRGNEINNNGFELTLQYIRSLLFSGAHSGHNIYWLFDPTTDTLMQDSFEYTDTLTLSHTNGKLKNVTAKIYDELIRSIYNSVSSAIKFNDLSLQRAYDLVNRAYSDTLLINQSIISNADDDVHRIIYANVEQVEPEEDPSLDRVYGEGDDAQQRPKADIKRYTKRDILVIDMSDTRRLVEEQKLKRIVGTCQHIISWQYITALQSFDPASYQDTLYQFIQQYAKETSSGAFICKSCNEQINLHGYVSDGVYDEDTGKYVTFSIPTQRDLAEIPEYERFTKAIRTIGSNIEKIATISNIPTIDKSARNAREARNALVKDVIDLVTLHNRRLKPILRNRNERAATTYGIDRDVSNLFVFELDDSVFVYSSRDKDQYKPIKQNNIIAYIVFLIILDLGESHITFIGADPRGMCNFNVFSKIYNVLFNGLSIIADTRGRVRPITEYPLLCYVIYIIGCSVVRYNMWHHEALVEKAKSKKVIPIVQKSFVVTIIDVINSIIEQVQHPSSRGLRLYEVIGAKYFRSMESIFRNTALYDKLRAMNTTQDAHVTIDDDTMIDTSNLAALPGIYVRPTTYQRLDIPPIIRLHFHQYRTTNWKRRALNTSPVIIADTSTTCPTGLFHAWVPVKARFVCKRCRYEYTPNANDASDTDATARAINYANLQEMSSRICITDGLFHQYDVDGFTCVKCKKSRIALLSLSERELDVLANKLKAIRAQQTRVIKPHSDKQKRHELIERDGAVIENTGIALAEFLQEIIGRERGSTVTSDLLNDIYVFDHNHHGTRLDKPLLINAASGNIHFRTNHLYFKTSVICYMPPKEKIEICYDAATHALLGYREESKDFIASSASAMNKLRINYSFANKLRLLGFTHNTIDVTLQIRYKLLELFYADVTMNEYVEIAWDVICNEIASDRLRKLDQVLIMMQTALGRIITGTPFSALPSQQTRHPQQQTRDTGDALRELVAKHAAQIDGRNITSDAFRNARNTVMSKRITVQMPDQNHMQRNIIMADSIISQDTHAQDVMTYFINECSMLVKSGRTNREQMSLAHFVIDFVSMTFAFYNEEDDDANMTTRQFKCLLQNRTRFVDPDRMQALEEYSVQSQTNELIVEQTDIDAETAAEIQNRVIDEQEEQEALDMENEYNYEQIDHGD